MKKHFILLLICFSIMISGCSINLTQNITPSANNEEQQTSDNSQTEPDEYDYVLQFPSDSYPETALHIYSAIQNGHSDVCTIDREGAYENRKQSLKGIETKEGYDRDEWPMAMCAEGGEGASVAYINPSDNRGAGSWVGNQLSAYENGERILFIVEKPKNLFGNTNKDKENIDEDLEEAIQSQGNSSNVEQNSAPNDKNVTYKNCTEAKAAGVAPLKKGDPGYSTKLDRDGDGIACEF